MARPWTNTLAVQATNVTAVTTAETIALTLTGIATERGGGPVQIDGTVDITTGAAATAVTLRVRQGTAVTGNVVGVAEVPAIGAAARGVFPILVIDQLGEVHNWSYVLTVQQTAATGNATINLAALTALY